MSADNKLWLCPYSPVRSVSTDNWSNLSVPIDRRFDTLILFSVENRRLTATEDIGQTSTVISN